MAGGYTTNEPAPFQVIEFSQKHRAREYKRRKPHSKTKDGCLGCKVKRVKV